MNLEIKEITNFTEDGKNKTRLVFGEKNENREIIFEGDGKLKMPVVEVQYVSGRSSGANGSVDIAGSSGTRLS